MNYALEELQLLRVVNSTAAGETNVNGSVIDMQALGADSVTFVAQFGALTSTQVTELKAQMGSAADGSDMADIAGSHTGPLADADSNDVLALEVVRPTLRYVRCVVVRGTANAAIDSVLAILAMPRQKPVTQPATVIASQTILSPQLGTA